MAPSVIVQKVPSQLPTEALNSTTPIAPQDVILAKSNVKLNKVVSQALANIINEIDNDDCEPGDEDPFFIADLAEVNRAVTLWNTHLPMVKPFYAVKCNPDIEVLKSLASQGCNFDCASKAEIETVINLGVDPSRIIYANPCKTASFIRHAKQLQVKLTTVDNTNELYKLAKFYPGMGILIRIVTDDETAQCRLSSKFGCSIKSAIEELLPLAKELGLNVRGVAFHVGSGASEFSSITKAIRDSKCVFDAGKYLDFDMTILDIGGGFQRESFIEASLVVKQSLDEYFCHEMNNGQLTVIAEPGRFMVANAFTLATHVIARRENSTDMHPMIYINDGVYGNMNCILFDHQNPKPAVLSHKGKCVLIEDKESSKISSVKKEMEFSIWGPTCDGLDCITSSCLLTYDIQVGDWLYFANLGAYTSAATTSFNGFTKEARVVYVDSDL